METAQHGSGRCDNRDGIRRPAAVAGGDPPEHGLLPDGAPTRSSKIGATGNGGPTVVHPEEDETYDWEAVDDSNTL